jgi:ABC-type molybdenum transport system ATPase subunit/photorepair protein PhrA
MMTRFRVRNYKCLKDVDIPLTPIHVLIGQNDSGKTSLLEAMFALYTIDESSDAAFPGNWTGRELVNLAASEPRIELGASARDAKGEFDYRIVLQFQGQGAGVATIARSDGNKEGNITEDIWRRIRATLSQVEIFRFNPEHMALPSSIHLGNGQSRQFRLDRDGFGLPTLLDEILSFDFEAFGRLRDTFRGYFPHFTNIRLEKTDRAFNRHTQKPGPDTFSNAPGKEIHLVTSNGAIRLGQASDGVILFLGFLALCHVPRPPRLLLIEEPENGIYPKRLGEVVRLLKHFVSENPQTAPQIVLTTHSPYLLSEFTPEEITFMCRQLDGSARARPLRDAPRIKERLGEDFEYLGELWYNYDEEVLFGDAQPTPSH